MLSQVEHLRYSRQISLSEIGVSGQEKLKASSVAIVGAGGLGSPLAFYLAAAGVGHLGIIDFDTVSVSNLHRQILHSDQFIGESKVESSLYTLTQRNPHVQITSHNVRLGKANAIDILRDYDLIADCSDNFATRYLVNDASVLLGIPNIFGSVYQFQGQVSIFGCKDGPCYRCLHPTPPKSGLIPGCAESGVLGILPGVIGCLQANEVAKLILGIGQPLIGRMAMIDALTSEWHTFRIQHDATCLICGDSPSIHSLNETATSCTSEPSIRPEELHQFKSEGVPFYLLDVREEEEAATLSMGANQRLSVDQLSDRFMEINAGLSDRIVVHCQTGSRSIRAVQILRQVGYQQVFNLEGGIIAWVEKFSEE